MIDPAPTESLSPHGSHPDVSVIIPCYNCVRFVQQTIDSVLRQEDVAVEIIAVNDGSTDETLAILESNPRVDKILTQANQGSGAARNTGAAVARGRYLIFLDSDDLLLPGAIRTLADVMSSTDAGFAYGQAFLIDIDGNRITNYAMGYHAPGKHTMQAVCRGILFQPSAVMFRRDIFEEIGGFYTPGDAEDWDILFRFAGLAEGVMTAKAVLEYRFHVQSKTRNYPKTLEHALAIQSANRRRYALWHKFPFSCLVGSLKVAFYFASEYRGSRNDPQAKYTESANRSIRKHPWVRLMIWTVPLLSRVKRMLRSRRNDGRE
jgi:glycosyltransferase involved in cell wall biosynthesis